MIHDDNLEPTVRPPPCWGTETPLAPGGCPDNLTETSLPTWPLAPVMEDHDQSPVCSVSDESPHLIGEEDGGYLEWMLVAGQSAPIFRSEAPARKPPPAGTLRHQILDQANPQTPCYKKQSGGSMAELQQEKDRRATGGRLHAGQRPFTGSPRQSTRRKPAMSAPAALLLRRFRLQAFPYSIPLTLRRDHA